MFSTPFCVVGSLLFVKGVILKVLRISFHEMFDGYTLREQLPSVAFEISCFVVHEFVFCYFLLLNGKHLHFLLDPETDTQALLFVVVVVVVDRFSMY